MSRATFAALFFTLLVPLLVLALALLIVRYLDLSVTAMIKMTVTTMAESTAGFILFLIAPLLQKASPPLQWLIEHLTDAVHNVRSPVSIDHAVAAMQIPLSLIDVIGEVVGTAMIATVESFLQYTTGAIYDFQLTSHIIKSIGGCVIFIAIALTSWLFKAALALRASRPYNAHPLPTPLGNLVGQDSTSQQRLDDPLSDDLPGPWAAPSDLPSKPFGKLFDFQPYRYNSPSNGPPELNAELPHDARLRPFIELALDPEILGQKIEEMRRRFSQARLRSSASSGGP